MMPPWLAKEKLGPVSGEAKEKQRGGGRRQ